MIDNEGIRIEDAGNCFLCGGEGVLLYGGLRDRLFGAPGIWSLMQCPKCQIVWLNPRPLPEDIGELYSQYYTHQIADAPKRSLEGLRKRIKASILRSSFGYEMEGSSRILGSVLSRIGPLEDIVGINVRYLKADDRGRLLDVGCGNGFFLDHMRRLGWDASGVELDGEAVSVAREKLGLEVFHGSLEEANFPDGYFDAVTVNHVIEHVLDPVGLLKECRRILRADGRLIVITPNIKSLGCCAIDENWVHWDPPRHLFIFSPEALGTCAERAGLILEDLRTTASNARWSWAISRLIKQDGILAEGLPKTLGVQQKIEGWAFQVVEHGLCCFGKVGDEIVMEATSSYRI